jgi:hypothetical protein
MKSLESNEAISEGAAFTNGIIGLIRREQVATWFSFYHMR